jgi:translation initiation factor IF-2
MVMAKIRVFELAKELDFSSNELISILKDLGVEVSSASSGVDDDTANLLREVASSNDAAPAEAPTIPVKTGAKAEPPKKTKAAPKAAPIKAAVSKAKTEAPKVKEPKTKVTVSEAKPAPPKKKAASPTVKPAPLVKATAVKEAPPKVEKKKKLESEAPVKEKAAPPAAKPKVQALPEVPKIESAPKTISITAPIKVGSLAEILKLSNSELVKYFITKGKMLSVNQLLDFETAAETAKHFGYIPEAAKKEKKAEIQLPPVKEKPKAEVILTPRPPVVTVLGHVDHGKTSLLDAIRKTNVTEEEAGGITQRIGAYVVDYDNRKIVFIDTPGHEAFTAMRARGAQVTDIAILVVAADDGVMPQTIEAIDHAKAAKVPIIVAINKIDKPQANIERVKQQLADVGLLAEDWGGDTVFINVSAKQKIGIQELLEMVLLVADLQELKANINCRAKGSVIEARMDKGMGPVATILVQEGTLNVNDTVIAGLACGKVRFMINDKGERIRKALPSTPVEIIGLSSLPQAGDQLVVMENDKLAREIAEGRMMVNREERIKIVQRASLNDLLKTSEEEKVKELNLIIKADVQGAVEALRHSLSRLTSKEVKINIIHGGVGTISESDVHLANASDAVIIGFNVRPEPGARRLAEQEGIEIRLYNVIYHVIDDLKALMVGMLAPTFEEALVGRAEVRSLFKIGKVGIIAGSYVTEGKITRNSNVRVIRNNTVVYEGRVESLKRFKDDVKEVIAGFECGIGIEKFGGLQEGDIIEAYQMQQAARKESVTPIN